MRIVTVIGARPQFVKAGIVSLALGEKNIEEIIVHTGQHFDGNMSDIFFSELGIPKPNYNLNINGLSHGAMTGRMMEEVEKILIIEKPDYLMVYGDTNSTLAGALAAQKLGIRIIHIEAGLRSFNMRMPEEVNRILTDRISNLLFCPTPGAVENLINEGFSQFANCTYHLVGDVMHDASLYYVKKTNDLDNKVKNLGLLENNYALVTVHRQENTDDINHITSIFKALDKISDTMEVVFPIHPRTRAILENLDLKTKVTLIEPVGYLDMLLLIKNSKLILTDSGGLQKEAYFFGKYCITLRNETEWVELIEEKVNRLVGTNQELILEAYQQFVSMDYPETADLYGSGLASKKIVDIILES